jgi:hypothetical protein
VPASLQNAAKKLDNLARRHRRGDEEATANAVRSAATTLGNRLTLVGQSGRPRRAAATAPAQGAPSTLERDVVEIERSIASSLATLVCSPANNMLIAC